MASKNPYPYCLDPGRLRQRVTLEQATTPSSGETNPTYATYLSNVPAEVIETTGGEYVRGRQVEAGIVAMVTIRYRNGIYPTMRLRYGARYLNIVSCIDPTGYRSELLIQCREVQP